MVVISLVISAVLAILGGLLIIIWPGLLRWVVGIWLILHGILQLLGS